MSRKIRELRVAMARLRQPVPRSMIFCIQNLMMARHLVGLFRAARKLGAFDIYYTVCSSTSALQHSEIARLFTGARYVEDRVAHGRRFFVGVVADHDYYGPLLSSCRRTLHTGHGSPSKTYKHDPSLPYEYSGKARRRDGEWRYDYFLEASSYVRDRLVEAEPSLAPRIRVLGNPVDDALLELRARRKKGSLSTVLVAGTCGEDSIFRTLGPVFFRALISHCAQRGDIRPVLAPHPAEACALKSAEWAPLLAELQSIGGRILEPGEDTLEVLAGADYLFADNTSVVHKAALLGIPVAMSRTAAGRIWKHGVTQVIQNMSPVLDSSVCLDELFSRLEQSKCAESLADAINSERGRYAENATRFLRELADELSVTG